MKLNFRWVALAFALLAGTAGYAAAQDYPYDRDDHRYYDRDDNRYDRDDFSWGMHVARELGYQDGAQIGREDLWRGKRFNPYPRGGNHADRGYRHEFGSRHEYREHYVQAYREGYMSAYRDWRYYR